MSPTLKKTFSRIIFLQALGLLSASYAKAIEWGEFNGKLEARSGYYLNYSNESPNTMGQFYLGAGSSANHENFSFKFYPVIALSLQDLSHTSSLRPHLELSEFWADYTSNSIDFFGGQQFVKWGAADGLNPTNIFKAYDLTDPYGPRELSQNAFGLRIHPLQTTDKILEILYAPNATRDLFPFKLKQQNKITPSDSRWGGVLPTSVEVGENSLVPLNYRMDDPKNNDTWDAGARLRLLQINNWDYSFVLGKFSRKRPLFTYNIEGDASNPALPLTLRLKPFFTRNSMTGFDASGSFEETGIRIEGAQYWVENKDRAVGYDSLIVNTGIDHLFSNLFNGNFYTNFTYVFIKNHKYNDFVKQNLDTAFASDYFSFRSEMRWSKWTLGNDLLYSVTSHYLDSLYLKHEVTPSFNLGIVATIVKGELGNGIGNFEENERITTSIEYFF